MILVEKSMWEPTIALSTSDGGLTWEQGKMTPLSNAAARLSISPVVPGRAYLAAYEEVVFRTDDGGILGVVCLHTLPPTLTVCWHILPIQMSC